MTDGLITNDELKEISDRAHRILLIHRTNEFHLGDFTIMDFATRYGLWIYNKSVIGVVSRRIFAHDYLGIRVTKNCEFYARNLLDLLRKTLTLDDLARI